MALEAFTGPCEGGPLEGTLGVRRQNNWPVWTYHVGQHLEPRLLGEYRWSNGAWRWFPERHLKLVVA